MRLVLIRYLFLIFSLFSINSWSQRNYTIDTSKIQRKIAGIKYNFRTYDLEQGLDNSYILSIAEDKFGNIWFGSAGNGVCKFDGIDFKWFIDFNGQSNNSVQTIFNDSKGNLWLGTFGAGITKFNGFEFQTFNTDNGLASNKIWCIKEDSEGNIWIGTHDNGVSKFDRNKFTNLNASNGLCNNTVRAVFCDNNNKIWLGTIKGISVIENGKITNYTSKNGLTEEYILAIAQDKNQKIYAGSYGNGIFEFNNGNFSEFQYNNQLTSKLICALLIDYKGDMWIGESRGGIDKFENNSIKHFTVKEGLNNNEVIALLQDKSNNLWIGTYGSGLCKFNSEKFSYFSTEEGLSSNVIRSLVQDTSNNIWISTSGGMINMFNQKSFYYYDETSGLNNRYILSSEIDKNGNLWFGTSGNGVLEKLGNSFKYFTTEEGLSSNYILNIFCDSKNRIWLGTYGGYACYLEDGKSTIIDKKSGLNSNFINVIKEDNQGNIWLGSENDGLFVYDGKIVKNAYPQSFNKKSIKSILFDNEGNQWVGTYGYGVFVIKQSKINQITDTVGLINNFVQSITQDNKGNIWIGTNTGITELIKITDNKTIKLPVFENFYIKSFGIKEGFIGNNCSTNAILCDNNGELWIGTGKNLTKFNPEYDNINTIKPKVFIKDVKLFFESINWKENSKYPELKFDSLSENYNIPIYITAPYYYNHFSFVFSAINMTFPEKVKYQFKLDGLDENWSPLTSKNEITYSGLKSGKYKFSVIAFNEDGVQSEKPIELYLEIIPPWWETKTFRILAILAILALIIFIIKFREKKLQKAKEKLELLVKQRTEEVVKQKEEIENKNEELHQQNEEIAAQRDEIEVQRDTVLQQKEHIEIIHKEVTDSINYAKRIQEAMLPDLSSKYQVPSSKFQDPNSKPQDLQSEKLRSSGMFIENSNQLSDERSQNNNLTIQQFNHLNETTNFKLQTTNIFVLFRPKDIVSGDFYWVAQVNDCFIVTVADCTGHGVPGAFMSMLGISFLNEIVRKEEVSQANQILIQLRKRIIYSMKQKGISGEQKDGMDISLIVIKTQDSNSKFQVSNPKFQETSEELTQDSLQRSDMFIEKESNNNLVATTNDNQSSKVPCDKDLSPKSQAPSEEESENVRQAESEQYSVIGKQLADNEHITSNSKLQTSNFFNAQWAGANNPLWIVRKTENLTGFQNLSGLGEDALANNEPQTTNNKLFEFKPDKMPIAIYERMDDFTNHEIQLFSGDLIYLMSDGYEDQFGGEKGKKFLSKNLKQLLIANCQLPMEEQKQVLEKTLVEWIGNGEQIDDITILGIKI